MNNKAYFQAVVMRMVFKIYHYGRMFYRRLRQGINPPIVKIIVPTSELDGEPEKWGGHFLSLMYGEKIYSGLPAAIPILAALVPPFMKVVVQDENIEEVTFKKDVDIVAITAHTPSVQRAYAIADRFRALGVKVILGGIHVSMMPEEAIEHADAIVIGEAEYVWPQALKDAMRNSLQKRYYSQMKANMNKQPLPRYDLSCKRSYYLHAVQTTRGCHFTCDFCSAHILYGKDMRYKNVRRIISEIQYIISLNKKMIHFADDAFVTERERTKKLLQALIPQKIYYTISTTINVYRDTELLQLLQKSGCIGVLIGFDSLNQEALNNAHKGEKYKVEEYYGAVEAIQSYGMLVCGSFIFGFDEDDKNVFKKVVDFVSKSGMGNCVMNILTPLPGTPLFKRLEQEGRILHRDWKKYDFHHVCFKPKRMSPEELLHGFYWASREVFSWEAVYRRITDLYRLWNEKKVRSYERRAPLMANLLMHHVSRNMSDKP